MQSPRSAEPLTAGPAINPQASPTDNIRGGGVQSPHTVSDGLPFETQGKQLEPGPARYFPIAKCPRRFCCQQSSVEAVQNGFSLP
jgi:hypothetical protein